MARIRTIKPEFWSSPDTAAVADPWARLLYIAMWNWCDDAGRGTANPKELAGFAFPNDESISSADIRRMLGEIRRGFGVTFYKVSGRTYYAIPSWTKHQKIDKRSEGRYPSPDEGEEWEPDPRPPSDQHKRNGSGVYTEPSAEPAESTPSPRRTPGAGTGEQGNRGTTTSATADAAPKPEDRFEEFWAVYPRKVKKEDARKAWRQITRKVAPGKLIATAKGQAQRWRSEGKEVRYVPYPASWLRGGSYDDEPEPARLSLVSSEPLSRDPDSALCDLRSRAAAQEAARIIGAPWYDQAQPPSDPTPPREWLRAQRQAWIDEHADQIRAALTRQQAG